MNSEQIGFNPEDKKNHGSAEAESDKFAREQAREKVIDIETKGLGYSSIGRVWWGERPEENKAERWKKFKDKLSQVIEYGLVGLSPAGKRDQERDDIKQRYISTHKELGSDTFVFANIVGRNERYSEVYTRVDRLPTEIADSYYMRFPGISIAVVFDTSRFIETEPMGTRKTNINLHSDKWTFSADDPEISRAFLKAKEVNPEIKIGDAALKNFGKGQFDSPAFDENGYPKPWQEYGFIFFPRIPKRFMKGIVIRNTEDMAKEIPEIVELLIGLFRQKPQFAMPIYDQIGNLIWPEKISHQKLVNQGKKQ